MKTLATLIVGTTVVALSGTSRAHADHVCRRHHVRAFDFADRELTRELERSRDVLRFDFEDQRDAIHARIRMAEEYYRRRERADAIRALHRELEHVERAYHRNLRALNEGAEDRRRELSHQRNEVLRNCRTDRCTEACFAEPQPAPRSIEVIPPPESVPAYPQLPSPNDNSKFHRHNDFERDRAAPFLAAARRRGHRTPEPSPTHRAGRPAPREEFDWQALVVDVLARRMDR
jgi:hypothetical protein